MGRHVSDSLATSQPGGMARDQINAFATRDEVRCDSDGDRDGIEGRTRALAGAHRPWGTARRRDMGTRYLCGLDGHSTSGTPLSSAPTPATVLGAAAAAGYRPHVAKIERPAPAERQDRGGAAAERRLGEAWARRSRVDGAGAPVRGCGVKGRGRPTE